MFNFYFLILSLFIFSSGCITAPGASGNLGYGEARRIVIVGEKVDTGIAEFYQRKYEALVWFTPSEGKLADTTDVMFRVGPSYAMRTLINELDSMNYSLGRWEIIVPKIAEKYFLTTLKHMSDGKLSKARGMIVLIDSAGNKDIEDQVQRVTDGNFFVSYEFQKY